MADVKRAAIVTLHGMTNFGNRLQNYAVDEKLRSLGYLPETLVFHRNPGLNAVLRLMGRSLVDSLGLRRHVSQRFRSFRDFDREMKLRTVWGEGDLPKIRDRYALVSVGSDQIWNRNFFSFGGAEFGVFSGTARLIAISPSFGVSAIPLDWEQDLRRGLANFDSISVREFDGQEIVESLTGDSVPVLIDPTLSLSADHWRSLGRRKFVPDSSYIVVYVLGDRLESTLKEVRKKSGKDCEIVILRSRDHPKYFGSGPQDFLALVDGASEVVTDSYHATIFSLLFDRPVTLVSRSDFAPMSSRFDTLGNHFALDFQPSSFIAGASSVIYDREQFSETLELLRGQYDEFVHRAVASE